MKKKVSSPKSTKKPSYDLTLVNDDSVSVAEMVEGKRSKRGKAVAARPAKKLSALDAAHQVLKGHKRSMNCAEMIAAMADQGLWQSPGGKTPWATLYSALLREIGAKGKAARFKKSERGQFEVVAGK